MASECRRQLCFTANAALPSPAARRGPSAFNAVSNSHTKTNRLHFHLLQRQLSSLNQGKERRTSGEFKSVFVCLLFYPGEALKSPCLAPCRWCLPALMTKSLARKQLSSAKNKLFRRGPLSRSKDTEQSSLQSAVRLFTHSALSPASRGGSDAQGGVLYERPHLINS